MMVVRNDQCQSVLIFVIYEKHTDKELDDMEFFSREFLTSLENTQKQKVCVIVQYVCIICQVLVPCCGHGSGQCVRILPRLTYYYKYSNISQPETEF